MEKYYFEIDAELNCKEECEYFSIDNYGKSDTVKIGSLACKQCEHNISYCGDENWIKCEVYSSFIENEKLKEENDARMRYIIKLTKENENLTEQVKQLSDEIFILKGGF